MRVSPGLLYWGMTDPALHGQGKTHSCDPSCSERSAGMPQSHGNISEFDAVKDIGGHREGIVHCTRKFVVQMGWCKCFTRGMIWEMK